MKAPLFVLAYLFLGLAALVRRSFIANPMPVCGIGATAIVWALSSSKWRKVANKLAAASDKSAEGLRL